MQTLHSRRHANTHTLCTDCHMNLYLHVWVQTYGSAFPMMLVFQHTKWKSASRLMDVSIYRWSVCHYDLGHSLSSTQNQALALKHSFISCLFRQMCDAEADGFIYASEKACLKNRQGKKRLENRRHWDRFRSPEFKTSQAHVEVGQSSTVPDLTFSDPDDCQHLRTG